MRDQISMIEVASVLQMVPSHICRFPVIAELLELSKMDMQVQLSLE